MKQIHGWKRKFTYREANMIAHMLAKFACYLFEDQIWMEDKPSFISDVLREEKTFVEEFDE